MKPTSKLPTHPMSMPWLDWQPITKEPRDFELILYANDKDFCWVGNHLEGCARGVWNENGAGYSTEGHPVAWARIPLPSRDR